MEAAKYKIRGSDYIGVFATANENFVFVGNAIENNQKKFLADTLGVQKVELSVSGSDLIGLFARANSKGIVFSNLMFDEELEKLKGMKLDINLGVIDSGLNAVGCNVLANDKIAIVNVEYHADAVRTIGDVLDVEVIKAKTDGFKTIGANNILTNKGLVINNRSTEEEKERLDKISGFDSIRTTANSGSLSIGLSVIANSRAVVVGDGTTGYEFNRILESLE